MSAEVPKLVLTTRQAGHDQGILKYVPAREPRAARYFRLSLNHPSRLSFVPRAHSPPRTGVPSAASRMVRVFSSRATRSWRCVRDFAPGTPRAHLLPRTADSSNPFPPHTFPPILPVFFLFLNAPILFVLLPFSICSDRTLYPCADVQRKARISLSFGSRRLQRLGCKSLGLY